MTDLELRPGRWIDVKAEGAVGDGVANDTTAIQAAITLASAGGVVVFPSGTYKITAPLNAEYNFVRLEGPGGDAATLLASGTWTSGQWMIDAGASTGVKGWSCRGLNLNAAGVAYNGIRVAGAGAETYRNDVYLNHVRSYLGTGIRVSNAGTGFGCHIHDNLVIGSQSGTTTQRGIDLSGPDNICAFNRVNNNMDAGLYLTIGGQQVAGNHVFANTIQSSGVTPTCVRDASGGFNQYLGNYFDNFLQNHAMIFAPTTGALNRPIVIGNKATCTGTMRNATNTANANFAFVSLDTTNGTIADVKILGNTGVSTVTTPFSNILNQIGSPAQIELSENTFNECSAFFSGSAPDRYGQNKRSSSGTYIFSNERHVAHTVLTYGTTVTPIPSQQYWATVVVTNGTAWTVANPGSKADGWEFTLEEQTQTATPGAISFGTDYILTGGTWTAAANGSRHTITFFCDGTNWIEKCRS